MIKKFDYDEKEYRDSGIIYKSMMEQICKAMEKDEQLAGELAISFFQMILREDHEYSSDNMLVDMVLSGYKHTINQAAKKYDDVIDAKKATMVEKYRYRDIILMKRKGAKGKEIVEKVGLGNTSKLSYHWQKIVAEQQDLLLELWPEYPKVVKEDEALVAPAVNYLDKKFEF